MSLFTKNPQKEDDNHYPLTCVAPLASKTWGFIPSFVSPADLPDIGAPARDPDAGRDAREAERGAGSLHAVRLQRELELGDAPLQHRPAPHRVREGEEGARAMC